MAEIPECPRGREEEYLADIAGLTDNAPKTPWSRKEAYLQAIDDKVEDIEEEIEELKNNPDVADIVATYADLEAYDTSKLTDKDIIRVLADEEHDGASTYYRWNASTQTFTYIGEVGDYYTKTQTNTLLADKQDKLTAGTNISINDETDTISCSISNFTGTDGTTAGAAGLVPAPAVADAGKFLKADGTWDSAGGGARVLTEADFNYPTGNNPTGICMQLLDPGIYMVKPVSADIPLYKGGNGGTSTSNTAATISVGTSTNILIAGNTGENTNKYAIVQGTNGVSQSMFGYYCGRLSTSSNYNAPFLRVPDLATSLTNNLSSSPAAASLTYTLNNKIENRIKTNAGAPTTATEGTKGALLEDTTNGKVYICTAVTPGVDPDPTTYTWVEVGAGGGEQFFVLSLSGSGVNRKCTNTYAEIKDALADGKILIAPGIPVETGSYTSGEDYTFGICTRTSALPTTGTTILSFISVADIGYGSPFFWESRTLQVDNANETLLNQGGFTYSSGVQSSYPTSVISGQAKQAISTKAVMDAVGLLANLTTTDKTNLVSAINEIKGEIGTIATVLHAINNGGES